ncbi:hypothetical protein [Streptomyces sp. ODS28]|uniref:hypothetical protein n=1 Tax=Streptomyces sp. ODS28 TaxID=3136688 RepID=UPI0031E9C924
MRRFAAAAIGATALVGGLAAPASADPPPVPQNGQVGPDTPAGPWQVTKDGLGTPLGEFQLPSSEQSLTTLPVI